MIVPLKPGDLVRIFLLLVSLAFIVHFLACGWFALVASDGYAWLDDGSGGRLDRTSHLASQYLTSYMATMLMLNGDGVDPTTDGQTLYVVLVVFAGSCVNATLFANVARLTSELSER